MTQVASHTAPPSKQPDPNLVLGDIPEFLGNSTPQAWVDKALDNLTILLIDHAQCEKKAASAAMSMMYKYVDRRELLSKMSKLAREELVHFDQVLKLMDDRGIQYTHLTAGRYAGALHELIRKSEPEKLVDRLILGAFVEARSCERFAALVPELFNRGDEELGRFYFSLLKSEARHYKDYLTLARQYSETDIAPRVTAFRDLEAHLIDTPDDTFRFHSGIPS
ncbi:tRNA-(ms[2]io[6]A)-hydroxylase [Saccharospirillum impatiens]|uniref:tRNA-(ms[2]io[6]A)-hydroxylase n=1 Tax=Saccharospirillum impatiens TaxID=169438 RepID=UPI001FE000B9|nr:tRNA-(ms[2]io[6]A)-hydroxylase [Saccharospirillum impatiens]